MHIMLISHKEIANYIDKLPKQKVDGWRGVSERFLHVHLNNHFSQTYEIIASVIQKDAELWDAFSRRFSENFRDLAGKYSRHPLFSDVDGQTAQAIVYDSYPLHPVSTFILPRLSEKVAQNERTLFTFLSAEGTSTLSAFLDTYDDQDFRVITPDLIYDYFEPLLKKEAYEGGIHHTFILASLILERLGDDLLQRKIVKTIALSGDDNSNEYKDLLQFLALPLKRMRKDDLAAHLSCRKECSELMMLQGKINSRTGNAEKPRALTDEEFDNYVSTLETLVTRISKVPQYAAWAREMQKAISEELLKSSRI